MPGSYAMQAYDAAKLIDSALKATGGNTADKEALRAALRKADFKSLRGAFKFNANGYPIQDFYLVKVAKRPDGKFQTEIVEKVFDELRRRVREGLHRRASVSTSPALRERSTWRSHGEPA